MRICCPCQPAKRLSQDFIERMEDRLSALAGGVFNGAIGGVSGGPVFGAKAADDLAMDDCWAQSPFGRGAFQVVGKGIE